MVNLKKKVHRGYPVEAVEASNTFADMEGISIKASQHSIYHNATGELMLVIIDFYTEDK